MSLNNLRGSLNKFPDFFPMGTFIDSTHIGQIVCDKDEVVDWCIVLVEMPLTRFEECWPLPTESLSELP